MKPSPGTFAIVLLLMGFGLCTVQFGWLGDAAPSRFSGAVLGIFVAVGLPLMAWVVLSPGRKSGEQDRTDDDGDLQWPGKSEGSDRD